MCPIAHPGSQEKFYSIENREAFRKAVQEQDDIQKKYIDAFTPNEPESKSPPGPTVSTTFIDLLVAWYRPGKPARGAAGL